MKHILPLLVATAMAAQAQEDFEEPQRPWSASLQVLRPVGADLPLELRADLARELQVPLLDGWLSVTPGVAGVLGRTDYDTTWSTSPRLDMSWYAGPWELLLHTRMDYRSWDTTDYLVSGGVERVLASSANRRTTLAWLAGTSRLTGEWTRATLAWSGVDNSWSKRASLGVGYLKDVEIVSMGQGNSSRQVRTSTADQVQILPSVQWGRSFGKYGATAHLDADLRGFERTSGGMGKGRMSSTASSTSFGWNATIDPWLDLSWSHPAWGINLSGGWSQATGMGGADLSGEWAALESYVTW